MMRQFPILYAGRQRKEHRWWPKSISWNLIEPHRNHAEKNHGQTLERLAERGGLDPVELWCVINDRGWFGAELPDEESAMEMIIEFTGQL